jgi:hypothetical protein
MGIWVEGVFGLNSIKGKDKDIKGDKDIDIKGDKDTYIKGG